MGPNPGNYGSEFPISCSRSTTNFKPKLVSAFDLPLHPGSQCAAQTNTTCFGGKEERLKLWLLHSPPVTPVKVDRLKFFLHGYDRALTHYLVDGFSFVFRVHFVGERLAYESPNLKSALDQPDLVKAKLSKECAAGRIVGPFTTPPFPNFRTSPLGIVPKTDPSEYRLIHHLSYLDGASVNDFIPDIYSTVKYASVGDASNSIKQLGRGCFMA